MLSKLLKDSLEKMSGREIKELCDGLGMTNIDKVIGENKQNPNRIYFNAV